MSGHALIQTLALVTTTAAVITVVFQRLRLPVVLGYLVAGFLVGPDASFWWVADAGVVQTLAELGVILLMFSLGLELSVRGVLGVGPGTIIATVIEVGLMTVLGTALGRVFGLPGNTSLFIGAMVAISSTTIIARTLADQPPPDHQRKLVFSVLVIEDLLAILLLTILTAVGRGAGLGVADLAITVAKLLGFLVATLAIGLMIVPRVVRIAVSLGRRETTLVMAIGLCFALAVTADAAGYSVALGAFVAGALIAESGEHHTIERLVEPVRDLFAAIFFVSVGMLIDPHAITGAWLEIVATLAVVVGGKILAVALGVFLSGRGISAAVATGMTLAQIGELSFVGSSIGVSSGILPPTWYAVAVAVSAITTALTPALAARGPVVAAWLEPRLPRRLATFAALYGSWIENLRGAASRRGTGPRLRRRAVYLAVDAGLLAGLVVASGIMLDPAARAIEDWLTIDPRVARAAVLVAAIGLAVPLLLGLARLSRVLAADLAERALPPRDGLDLAAAPRRMLIVALQVPVLVLALLPTLAATGAIAPPLALALMAALVAIEAWRVWRSAGDLDDHVRAGAHAIVEVLAAQIHRRAPTADPDPDASPEPPAAAPLELVDQMLPGLGTPTAVRVAAASSLAGQSLGHANLRGRTGATVLAIQRGEVSIAVPSATDTIEPGDLLALAGSRAAIDAATALLVGES